MLLILRSKEKIGPKMKKFMELLGKRLKENGQAFSFSSFENIELFLSKEKIKLLVDGKPLTTWSTIYPRKVGKNRGLAHILAQLSKNLGLYFIDRYHEQTKDSSDTAKIIQMFRLALNGVSIPKTYFAGTYSKKNLQTAVTHLGLPIVVKECNTSQGAGVFLAKNLSALEKIIQERFTQDNKKEIFLQEFIANDFEYRLLVMGDKIGVAEKKIRAKGEFRNNVHLGAREEFIEISQVKSHLKKEALLAAKITNIQVAGVDIIEQKDGSPIIFEVNSCPALTLDEKISPEIKNLAQYLTRCEKK